MADTLTAYIPNTQITEVVSSIGFIDTTSYLTRINVPVGVNADLTLNSGFTVGQLKKIQLIVDMGAFTATVSGQRFLDGISQTITFTLPGDTAELMWTRNGWRIISTSSSLGTDVTPVVS